MINFIEKCLIYSIFSPVGNVHLMYKKKLKQEQQNNNVIWYLGQETQTISGNIGVCGARTNQHQK